MVGRCVFRACDHLFEATDRSELRPLPKTPYEYTEHRKPKPCIDYHLDIDKQLNILLLSVVGQGSLKAFFLYLAGG